MRRLHYAVVTMSLTMLVASTALAQPKPGSPPPTPGPATPADPKKVEARKLFRDAVAQAGEQKYAEALGNFEHAHELYPGAEISYNIGFCERALGRYVRAKLALQRALAENAATGELDEGTLNATKGLLEKIESVIVRAKVTVHPTEAAITIDGAPIIPISDDKKTFGAGVAPQGRGEPAPAETFDLVLDPGSHVFVLARKGFSDFVDKKTLSPQEQPHSLVFELEKLPARIKISSSVDNSIVKVGPVDVGATPVDVSRPAGVYPISVQKEGFVTYETSLSVKAGEEAKINAVLKKKSFNVAEQWWFWTGIAAGLGTAAVITYFVARPEPDPPPYNGGSTGWVVQSYPFRF